MKTIETKFKKAPIVYQGNKYRLLKRIVPFFPQDINNLTVVDLFGGSSVITLNLGKQNIYNELNPFIKGMIEFIYNDTQTLIDRFNELKTEYEMDSKLDTEEEIARFKAQYNKLRAYANSLEYMTKEHIAAIYTCHIFAINNLIRFNKSNGFNASSGHRKGNTHPIKKIVEFERPDKTVMFSSNDFEVVINDVLESDLNPEEVFFYLDPPYLNTTAVYNENRLTGWNIKDDERLFLKLDELTKLGYKWAYSNTFTGKDGTENTHIEEWAQKYNINYLDVNYASFGNSNRKNREVLITNYKGETNE